ncbi:YiiD C-terminal domain-containing protein [Daejeonella sp.]|jgi:hypothetical protein|uniref:YiiD C-terminal domain-containing protein n=1 Tax=Daejeonella sp. TaxID=2805397 RepID=UPI0037BE5B15
MNITDLPFNKLIDIKVSTDPDYLLILDDKKDYTNHLDTVHASALFSLAEATSGHFLMINFPEFDSGLIPVVRQVEVKYKKPANGQVNSTAMLIDNTIDEIKEQLTTRKRVSLKLKIELYDINKINVMSGNFEWFVTILNTST